MPQASPTAGADPGEGGRMAAGLHLSGTSGVCATPVLAAHAAALTTSRLYRNGDHGLRCEATNVGRKTLPLVHMALVQNDGTEVSPNDCLDLAPNATCGVASADVGGGAFCRITFKGSARQIRGMISAYDLTNGAVVAIESAR